MTASNINIQTWKYHIGQSITTVCIAANGDTVLAGLSDKRVVCLDGSGALRWKSNFDNIAWQVGLSRNGETAVIGTNSRQLWGQDKCGIFCFDPSGSLRWQKNLTTSVLGLALSADGRTIAVITSTRQLRLFNELGGELNQQQLSGIGPYTEHGGVALSAEGYVVAVYAGTNQAYILGHDGVPVATYQTRGIVAALDVSDDGTNIVVGDSDGWVYNLDGRGKLLWKAPVADKIWSVTINSEEKTLLVGCGRKEGDLYQYDHSGQLLWHHEVDAAVIDTAVGESGFPVMTRTYTGSVYILDKSGEILYETPHNNSINSAAISTTGSHFIVGTKDGSLYYTQVPSKDALTKIVTSEDDSGNASETPFGQKGFINSLLSNLPLYPSVTARPEQLRLDAAVPKEVFIGHSFILAVAVRQPTSAQISEEELTLVRSNTMLLDWPRTQDYIQLRIQLNAPDCEIDEAPDPSIRLYRGLDSPIFFFHLRPKKRGRISIIVHVLYDGDNMGSARIHTRSRKEPAQVAGAVELEIFSSGLDHEFEPDALRLFDLMLALLDTEELRTLCFRIEIEYEDLGGESRQGKVRELVRRMQRLHRLGDLYAGIQQMAAQNKVDLSTYQCQ
ncbi:MAG: PQQ-binding-like beta-propeller repeat protein [Chloroflexota bacterium]